MLRDALALDPQHLPSLINLGHIARRRGDRATALASFAAAAAAQPAHAGVKAEAATDLRELGRLDEAEAMLRGALAVEPAHLPALIGLGHLARRRGDRVAALAALQAAAMAHPTHAGVKAEAANDLRELGRFDEAENMLNQALAADPKHAGALLGRGHLARRRGDRAAALAAFEAALAVNPDNVGLAADVANMLRELGKLEAAEARFQQLLAINPANIVALIGLGSIKLDQFRLDDAEELFGRAVAAAPHDPAPHLSLARLARRRGNHKQSLACFEAARAANASHAGAALETAGALRDLGCLDEARDIIDEILRLNPRDHAAAMQLALLHRCEGRRREALAGFQSAHELQPTQPQPLVEMAIEYRALGKPQKSEELLRHAVAIQPDHQAALEQLSEHHLISEHFEEALSIARQMIEAYPHRAGPYLKASRATAELGRNDEAIAFLDQAAASAGHQPEITAARANLHILQRQWAAAYALLLDPRAQTPSHTCLWTLLARLSIITGELRGAESILPPAPAAAHEASRVRLFQGQIAEARWQLTKAAEHYLGAVALAPNDGSPHAELARLSLKLLDIDACRHHLGRMTEISASALQQRSLSLHVSQTHVGQLLDEFSLDQPLLNILRDIRRLPVKEQIAPLKDFVVRNPDHTPGAIMLLIAMRQAGSLVRHPSRPADGTFARIPRRIVQFWDDDEPPAEIAELMATWKQAHPDFNYIRLNDGTAREFLRARGMGDALAAYSRAREPAQRADLIRLAYLSVQGGFYADADDRCIAPLGSFVPPDAALVTWQEDFGTLGNNFLGAAPGHPVIALALRLGTEALNRGDNDFLWLSTGPGLLSRAFAQVVAGLSGASAEGPDVATFDYGFLNRRVGFHCQVTYKKTARHWGRSSFGRPKPIRFLPNLLDSGA